MQNIKYKSISIIFPSQNHSNRHNNTLDNNEHLKSILVKNIAQISAGKLVFAIYETIFIN